MSDMLYSSQTSLFPIHLPHGRLGRLGRFGTRNPDSGGPVSYDWAALPPECNIMKKDGTKCRLPNTKAKRGFSFFSALLLFQIDLFGECFAQCFGFLPLPLTVREKPVVPYLLPCPGSSQRGRGWSEGTVRRQRDDVTTTTWAVG